LASAAVTFVEEVPFASLDQAPSFSCMLGNCPKANVLYTATTNIRRNTCPFVHGTSKQKNNFSICMYPYIVIKIRKKHVHREFFSQKFS
jgi:hypothetical protein